MDGATNSLLRTSSVFMSLFLFQNRDVLWQRDWQSTRKTCWELRLPPGSSFPPILWFPFQYYHPTFIWATLIVVTSWPLVNKDSPRHRCWKLFTTFRVILWKDKQTGGKNEHLIRLDASLMKEKRFQLKPVRDKYLLIEIVFWNSLSLMWISLLGFIK